MKVGLEMTVTKRSATKIAMAMAHATTALAVVPQDGATLTVVSKLVLMLAQIMANVAMALAFAVKVGLV